MWGIPGRLVRSKRHSIPVRVLYPHHRFRSIDIDHDCESLPLRSGRLILGLPSEPAKVLCVLVVRWAWIVQQRRASIAIAAYGGESLTSDLSQRDPQSDYWTTEHYKPVDFITMLAPSTRVDCGCMTTKGSGMRQDSIHQRRETIGSRRPPQPRTRHHRRDGTGRSVRGVRSRHSRTREGRLAR
jgi:hypothetical protein